MLVNSNTHSENVNIRMSSTPCTGRTVSPSSPSSADYYDLDDRGIVMPNEKAINRGNDVSETQTFKKTSCALNRQCTVTTVLSDTNSSSSADLMVHRHSTQKSGCRKCSSKNLLQSAIALLLMLTITLAALYVSEKRKSKQIIEEVMVS